MDNIPPNSSARTSIGIMLLFFVVAACGIPISVIQNDDTIGVSAPIIITVPAPTQDYPFEVSENRIIYTYHDTLDWPCNYIIEGRIFGLEGQPYSNAVVNIEMLRDISSGRASVANPAERLGPSGWSALLVSWDVAYEVWLSETIGSEPLSPRVYVPPRGCDNNVASVDFVQVRSLP